MSKKKNTPVCLRTPKFYIWNREAIFLGTCYARHQTHRTTQEKLILCLKGSLIVRTASGAPVETRSCLMGPGLWFTKSMLDASKAVIAIYFLQPFSQDYAALASLMTEAIPGVYYDHPHEEALISAAVDIRNQPEASPTETRSLIREALFPPHVVGVIFRETDPRVITIARTVRESLHNQPTLAEMAEDVHLSESRLEKLFKDQVGLPITQYRLRYRVFIGTILMAMGHSVTDAALYAGFSSSAHFSRSYRAINGMTPSTVFLRPPYLHPVIDDSAAELVASLVKGQSVS